jgi:hypothetical protein
MTKTSKIGITVTVLAAAAFALSNAAVAAPVPVKAQSGTATVLYAANWSSGLNGWAGEPSWKTLRGQMVNDGTSDNSKPILAPYDTGRLSDYAVEARIRVTRAGGYSRDGFGLTARSASDGGGYAGAIWQGYPASVGYVDTWDPLMRGQNFVPDAGWHTYRLEVDGNVATFFADGAQLASAPDNRYLTGGHTGIFSDSYQIEVATFRILRLR